MSQPFHYDAGRPDSALVDSARHALATGSPHLGLGDVDAALAVHVFYSFYEILGKDSTPQVGYCPDWWLSTRNGADGGPVGFWQMILREGLAGLRNVRVGLVAGLGWFWV